MTDIERKSAWSWWSQCPCCGSRVPVAGDWHWPNTATATGEVIRLRQELAEAVQLLNDAQTTIIDTDLRRKWEAERTRLRSVIEVRPS